MTNVLGFLRSEMAFNDFVSIDALSFFPRLAKDLGVAEHLDSIFFSEPEGWNKVDPQSYGPDKLPSWVNFFEVLRIGDNVASFAIEDRLRSDTGLGDNLVGAMRHSGGIEIPTFGRRMAIVSYDDERTDGKVIRSDDKFRRALGHTATGVWHGLDVIAYCFVDNRSVHAISEGLEGAADDLVTDYIVVEPLEVLLPDKTNVSPLSEWLASGFRRPAKRPV